jgi:hypothetical protein
MRRRSGRDDIAGRRRNPRTDMKVGHYKDEETRNPNKDGEKRSPRPTLRQKREG